MTILDKKQRYSSSFKQLTRKFTYSNIIWWSFRLLIYLILSCLAVLSIYQSHKQFKIKTADHQMRQEDEVEFPAITICAPTIITPKLLSGKHIVIFFKKKKGNQN